MKEGALLLKLGALAAFLSTLFWSFWHLFWGPVPKTAEVFLMSMSRWTDIVFVPVWVFIVSLLFLRRDTVKEHESVSTITMSILVWLLFGLFWSWYDFSPWFVPIITLFHGFIIGFLFGFHMGLSLMVGFCLSLGVVFGMGEGLIPLPIMCVAPMAGSLCFRVIKPILKKQII